MQIDKHLDKLQQEFDGQQDMAARRAGSGGASGGGTAVIQQIMWALQTQLKLSKATELLRLMLGPELSKADETGNAGASTGLRACLGVAQDLHHEVEVFRQQQFGAWEVSEGAFAMAEVCIAEQQHSVQHAVGSISNRANGVANRRMLLCKHSLPSALL